jgi:hypothetical protein
MQCSAPRRAPVPWPPTNPAALASPSPRPGGGGGRRADSRVASAAVRAASLLRAVTAMGTVTHVALSWCAPRGARRPGTQRVVHGRNTRRERPAERRGPKSAEPPAFRSRGDPGTKTHARGGPPMSRWWARGSATSPPPWRAPRCGSMVAVCLRPPNATAPVGDPRLSPPLWTPLASSTSAPALPARDPLLVASGTPGSAAPALASSEGSLDALACAVDEMCCALERVGAPSSPVAGGIRRPSRSSTTSASL